MKSFDPSFSSIDQLQAFPKYAAYLLSYKLDDYCQLQLSLSAEIDIPVFKYIQVLPEAERLTLTRQSINEFLSCISQNKAAHYIETSMDRWKQNQMNVVDRDAIKADDINLIAYLRKKLLLHFIPAYTKDPEEIITLFKEIDFFQTTLTTIASNTYIDLLKNRLEEHSHFIQKVNETIPGAIYVYDWKEDKGVYSNHKLPTIIGYSQAELNEMGGDAIKQLIHPDDQEHLYNQLRTIKKATDGETISTRYRVREKNGNYRWVAAYEAVFKRKDDGSVWQTIGITLDIENEQKAIAEKQRLIKSLSRSEALYKKAEEIANMGNWVWYVKRGKLEWTDQLYRIYGLEPQSEEITIERFLSFVHPEDYQFVKAGVDELTRNDNLEYTFRIITSDGTVKWLRSLAHVIYDKAGAVSTIIGIEQDVTEKEELIHRLRQSEKLYKQAQSLAHLGSWSFDLLTKEISWSEELYAIYEREPGAPLTPEEWYQWLDPKEKERVDAEFAKAIEGKKALETIHQIRLPNGKVKTLHRRGEVILDTAGRPFKLVGTTQDITEQIQVQSELKESQTFIRKITDATPSIIATYNINTGSYTFISEGVEKLLGYTTGEVMEKGTAFFLDII
ncbi:MAG: PAS domain-containing protein, partial [Bacteroidota bacterium]|nr:PAS domain-containing protein [Bacteroidota bacterium]